MTRVPSSAFSFQQNFIKMTAVQLPNLATPQPDRRHE